MTRRPALRIEGDHSDYHGGCAAVMRALRALAAAKGWRVVGRLQRYDALLVNGEGSMHHGTKTFRRKMKKLRKAVEEGKPAYLVNSVWQENPADFDDVLPRLSGICVREVLSQADLLERHGIHARVVPDVSIFDRLPRWTLRRDYGGVPVRTDFWTPDTRSFIECEEMFPGVERLPFSKWSWGRSVASLRTASYLITGRQHAVYAACKARTRFVATEGNTHKIAGFLKTAGVDIPVAHHPEELPDMRDIPERYEAEFTRLFDWIEAIDYSGAVPSPGEVWPVRS